MFGHDDNNDQDQKATGPGNSGPAGGLPPLPPTPLGSANLATPPPQPTASDLTAPSLSGPKNSPTIPSNDELVDLKRQALQQLTPLVSHLDQSAEEKFRTTMMMIQAADDKTLIKTAYEAAKQIGDEKKRAQALLDVVNEINYFTQPPTPEAVKKS